MIATGVNELSFFTLTNETCRIYFNIYTFTLLHSIVGVVAVIVGALSQNKKAETPSN